MGKILTICKLGVKQLIKGSVGLLYKVLTNFPLQQKAVFVSTRSNAQSENLQPLIDELQQRSTALTIVVHNAKMATNITQIMTTPLFFMKILYHLATARYFIIDDYCLPVYLVKKRPGVEVIQVWHAAGALKKFGNSISVKADSRLKQVENELIRAHSNYDKAIVSSPAAKQAFAEAFQMPLDNIIALGTPKTDVLVTQDFIDESRLKREALFPSQNEETKIIVYAPTFREINRKREPFQFAFQDIAALYQVLEQKNLVFVMQLHPYNHTQWQIPSQYNDRIILNKVLSTAELLVVSDALLTDYSSVLFDYSLLNKPMAFFMPDIAVYQQERGFYGDILAELPGAVLESETAVYEWLLTFETQLDSKTVTFQHKWFADSIGKASANITNYMLRGE